MKTFKDYLLESNTIYYHGTNSNFDDFNIEADKVNRGTNVSGVYFTPRKYEAESFGERVIAAKLFINKPFYNNKFNKISNKMAEVTKQELLKYTRYKSDWIDDVILPNFIKDGSLKEIMNLNGDIKRKVLIAGGYDSYIDGDHIVILSPSKNSIKVIK